MDRKRFPIEDYPKIAEYIGDKVNKDYMQYPYRLLDDQSMANVILAWIDYYESRIDRTVENTLKIFDLCGTSLGGHEFLGERWDWPGRKPHGYTSEDIRAAYRDKLVASICHLFQKFGDFTGKEGEERVYKFHKTHTGGATGLGLSASWSLEFYESDLKSVAANCVTDFRFGIDIENSTHTEQNIYDY